MIKMGTERLQDWWVRGVGGHLDNDLQRLGGGQGCLAHRALKGKVWFHHVLLVVASRGRNCLPDFFYEFAEVFPILHRVVEDLSDGYRKSFPASIRRQSTMGTDHSYATYE